MHDCPGAIKEGKLIVPNHPLHQRDQIPADILRRRFHGAEQARFTQPARVRDGCQFIKIWPRRAGQGGVKPGAVELDVDEWPRPSRRQDAGWPPSQPMSQ
jgi:hypothetical protein